MSAICHRTGALILNERRRTFEAVYRDHLGSVLAYAARRSPWHQAQEVAAETFLVAWRRLEEVPDDALPWLYGVARRVLANQRRAGKRRAALDVKVARTADFASTDPTGEVDERIFLLNALKGLPERDREAIALSAWEDLEPRRAAAAMGCSPATFAVRLHRARRRLRHELESASPPPQGTSTHSTAEELR